MPKNPNECGALEDLKVKLPQGDWLVAISDLQRSFGSRFCDFDSLPERSRIDKTQYYLACISNELEEIRDWLPWKEHKKYDPFQVDKVEIQFELIDILCYLLNLCFVWGMDPLLIITRYLQKNHENVDRQMRGY